MLAQNALILGTSWPILKTDFDLLLKITEYKHTFILMNNNMPVGI